MISSAAGGVPLLMVRHPTGPSASLLAFGGVCVFSDHAFVEGARLAGFGMLMCSHYAGGVYFLIMLLLFARFSFPH